MAQAGLIYVITHEAPPPFQNLAAELLDFCLKPAEIDKSAYLLQPAIIAFALSFILIVVRLLMKAATFVAGLLGAMPASTIALQLDGLLSFKILIIIRTRIYLLPKVTLKRCLVLLTTNLTIY